MSCVHFWVFFLGVLATGHRRVGSWIVTDRVIALQCLNDGCKVGDVQLFEDALRQRWRRGTGRSGGVASTAGR